MHGARRLAGGLAGVQVFTLLDSAGHFEDPDGARRHRAGGADLDLPAFGSEHRVAARVGQHAPGRHRELPVAGVADALWRLDREEAVALDREVERFARFLHRAGRHVGVGLAERDALVDGADRRAALGVRHQHFAEAVLRRFIGLEARGRRVGEVVGELILADLLGDHPRGCYVEAEIHSQPWCSTMARGP